MQTWRKKPSFPALMRELGGLKKKNLPGGFVDQKAIQAGVKKLTRLHGEHKREPGEGSGLSRQSRRQLLS